MIKRNIPQYLSNIIKVICKLLAATSYRLEQQTTVSDAFANETYNESPGKLFVTPFANFHWHL